MEQEKYEIIPLEVNADLHNHTRGSDGRQSSFRMLLRAANNGKNIVALTDHDSVDGFKNLEEDMYSVIKTIENDKSYDPDKILNILENINILKATELITSYKGVIIEVLGYNFDVDKMDEEIKKLKETVKQKPYEALYEGLKKVMQEKNIIFNKEVLDKAYQDIIITGKGGVVGPFFNELSSHEENSYLLKYIDEDGNEKQADTLKLFINKHLYNKESNLFVDMSSTRPTYKDTIDAIHRAGGIASLAHPGRYNDKFNVEENIDDMIEIGGLDIVEVFYPDHSYEYREMLLQKVRNHGIKASGGSDDHHSIKEGIQYNMSRVSVPQIEETKWIEESVQSGKEFIQNSKVMQDAIKRLRELKEERMDKEKINSKLQSQIDKNYTKE